MYSESNNGDINSLNIESNYNPDELCSNIKYSHQVILDNFDQIQKGIGATKQLSVVQYNRLKPLLKTLEGSLLAHFQRQDSDLYDVLNKFYADNRSDLNSI